MICRPGIRQSSQMSCSGSLKLMIIGTILFTVTWKTYKNVTNFYRDREGYGNDPMEECKYVCVCVCVCVCFRVNIKRQQAQSINISKHPSKPTSINLNTTIHTLI